MLYHVIVRVIRLSLKIYFKRVVVAGKENIPNQGPLIIAANHPSTFMDPMIIASITKQRIGFVANAGIFRNSFVSSLFRYFHIIPIFRKKDVREGEKQDNQQSFRMCHEYLSNAGTLLIFPEGSSIYELRLREIKTGTARIAISYENVKNFQDNLKIVPIALDYSDSIYFRSMVSVSVCQAIEVKGYRQLSEQNEEMAVREITDDIGKKLSDYVPKTSGKEQEKFLILAHKFYSAYYETEADLYRNPKLSLERRKQLSDALATMEINNPLVYAESQKSIGNFFSQLESVKLTPGFLAENFQRSNKIVVFAGYLLEFILLLPVYLFGILANYLPYFLPSVIYKMSKLEIEYKTPLQMVVGLILFPLFYFLEMFLFRKYVTSDLFFSFLFFALLPVSGFIAMYYWTELRRFSRFLHYVFSVNKDSLAGLLELRDSILTLLKQQIQNAKTTA